MKHTIGIDELRGPAGQSAQAPDWVMLGASMVDGSVMLLASKELTYGELEGEVDEVELDRSMRYGTLAPSMRYRVRADMKTFVLITAPDYERAFAHLFTQWKPERARRGALTASPPALPGDTPADAG